MIVTKENGTIYTNGLTKAVIDWHIDNNMTIADVNRPLNKDEEGNLFISFKVTQEIEIEDLIKKWLPYLKVIEPISLDEKIKLDIKKYLG